MSEMTEGTMAGTAATGAPVVVVVEDKAKEVTPVRFFDNGQPTRADKDFRPGVAQAIQPTAPRSVTVQPGGGLAGSPNLLDRAVDVVEVVDAGLPPEVVPEGAPPLPPAPAADATAETPKAPAKA